MNETPPLRTRALLLTAGLGTRLRPLTHVVPKPLLPVAGKSVAAWSLEALAGFGCEAVALNLHHLGGQIEAAFGSAFHGLPLTYSPEPEILGTLGALAPLADFFAAAEAALVINGDSLCRWPLAELTAFHAEHGGRVSLLVADAADPDEFGGGIGLDAAGRVVSFRRQGLSVGEAVSRKVFAGAHVLAPELLRGLPLRPADIVSELYEPLLAAGEPIHTLPTSRPWHDLGTAARYLAGAREFLAERGRGRFVSASAQVAAEAEVRASAIEGGAEVASGAVVEESLVLPGARVGAGARVRRSIIGFGAVIPPRATLDGELVTVRDPAFPLQPGARIDGELVRQPLTAQG